MKSASPTKVDNIILMIHGTWGRGPLSFLRHSVAGWCRDESAFVKTVSRNLKGNTETALFNWSGDNDADSRYKAAELLSTKIEELRTEHPNAKLHVFAHSHGGNIAMIALKNTPDTTHVQTLTCMSTPFLLLKPQKYSKKSREGIATIYFVFLAFIFSILGIFISNYLNIDRQVLFQLVDWFSKTLGIENSGLSELLVFSLLSLVLGLLFTGAVHLSRYLVNLAERKAALVLEKNSLPTELPFNVLLIRSDGDEAKLVLAASQFIFFLSEIVQSLLLRISPKLSPQTVSDEGSISGWPASIKKFFRQKNISSLSFWPSATLIVVLAIFINAFQSRFLESGDLIPFLEIGLVAAAVRTLIPILIDFFAILVSFALAPVVILLALIQSTSMLFFGMGFTLHAWFLRVSVESTPEGNWTIHQVLTSVEKSNRNLMRHSTHSDLEALTVLGEWLRVHSESQPNEP